ncbi:MAG: LDCC motif putative metal-binding protein [Clostridium sp.]|nr:LDCC motif putative metal-binding protein [Clostridium sp.]MDU7252981.1 LDCC motif putative metal-binding protein [Clostridium sp.]
MFKFLRNFLQKLEQKNSKSFGNSKLDCCDLNKSNNSRKTNNKKK